MPPPPSEFTGTPNPTSSCEEHGGRLPRKKRTSVSWLRRGRRGLRLRRGASSHGGSRSYGRVSIVRTVLDTAVAGVRGPGPIHREIWNREVKRRRRDSSRGKVYRPNTGAEARWSFCKAGGMGTCGNYSRVQRSGGGTPSPVTSSFDIRRHNLTLGFRNMILRPATTR